MSVNAIQKVIKNVIASIAPGDRIANNDTEVVKLTPLAIKTKHIRDLRRKLENCTAEQKHDKDWIMKTTRNIMEIISKRNNLKITNPRIVSGTIPKPKPSENVAIIPFSETVVASSCGNLDVRLQTNFMHIFEKQKWKIRNGTSERRERKPSRVDVSHSQ